MISFQLLTREPQNTNLLKRTDPYAEPSPLALEDAQRTLGLVRFHAADWHIDPHRIGVSHPRHDRQASDPTAHGRSPALGRTPAPPPVPENLAPNNGA